MAFEFRVSEKKKKKT